MYFLSAPTPLSGGIPLDDVADDLHRRYFGFVPFPPKTLRQLEEKYGSVEQFVERRFGVAVEPLHVRLAELEQARDEEEKDPDSTPPSISAEDARDKVYREIVRRQGQPKFRKKLIEAYGGRCAITGCSVEEVLEAAHIIPYNGESTNVVTNGVLLRADLHTLFDLGLVNINPDYTISVSAALDAEDYRQLDGQKLKLPRERKEWPSAEALSSRQPNRE
ncbi:hypothetical protein CF392_16180 [Tamilnaduibacter salinus]|uniref:HNH nuclease domain-containing protein n=2 Tax=Tamilnaduibacter salinus TaxID=1484056 RepID=A0A2A2HYY8_9GAMM|nr:hypothetical protein CF392_16180 [Tamilnaduibacter salinus]